MTAWIRKNPFTTTDPKMEMVRFVSEWANSLGSPLSEADHAILASENPDVDELTERRLRSLVAGVIANQKAPRHDADPKSFVGALEWATDGEWPYVAALAEAEIMGSPTVKRFERRGYSGWWLIPGCLVVILLIGLLVLMAHRFL
jgi:hypothetical protein